MGKNLIISSDNKHLRVSASELNLAIVPFGNTHHVGNSQSCLDVFLMNDISKLLQNTQAPTDISNHDMISIVVEVHPPKPWSRTF